MKKNYSFLLILSLFATNLFSQNSLIGVYWTGNEEIFTLYDLSSQTFKKVDTIKGVVGAAQGESALDSKTNRFFTKTNLGILVIDSQNGMVLDTISNTPKNLFGIEYNPNTNKLLGVYKDDTKQIFASYDLSSKTFTDIAILNGVAGISQGESALDSKTNRYFIKTKLGVLAIDSQNGIVLDTISNTPKNLFGIEYNPNTNKLLGAYWDGTKQIFASYDLSSKTFTDIATINNIKGIIQGESSFDTTTNTYFIKTNLGILAIDSQSGAVLYTINDPVISMFHLQLIYNKIICKKLITKQPVDQLVLISSNAQFKILSPEPSATYQWQVLTGTTFQNLTNAGQYSGATTNTLNISAVSLSNHEQKFRCIVKSNSCSDTSKISTLKIKLVKSESKKQFKASPGLITNNNFNVEVNTELVGSAYRFIDQFGNVVLTNKITSEKSIIEISKLPKGVYIFTIDNTNQIFKLIKN